MTGGLDAIKEALADRLEELAVDLLGQPNAATRNRREWTWGNKGARKLVVRGDGRGRFFDHEAAEGGGPLDMILSVRGRGLADAIGFARGWTGLDGNDDAAERLRADARRERERERAVGDAAEQADHGRRIAHARRLAAEAVPLAPEHPGWRYLTGPRAIPAEAVRGAAGSGAVRFHARLSALVFVASTDEGDIHGVQLVHVTPDGEKRPATEEHPIAKVSHGWFQGGAVVRLPGDRSDLLLNEGPETGLSAWAATGRETWIVLGGVGKAAPPAMRRLCVCADDDPRHSPAAKALARAVARWRGEGRSVAVALPWPRRRFDKSDFNDALSRDGIQAVRARIEAAIAPPPRPPGGEPIPVELARERLRAAAVGFMRAAVAHLPGDEALDGAPPVVHAIRAGVGIGKSDRVRRELAGFITGLRAKGDKRNAAFAIPTHKLADEQAREFERLPEARAAGLRAAVWRGREAPDPSAPGETMCRDLDAVRAAASIGLKPETAVCRDRKTGAECPFFRECGYQRQKHAKADLWFAAHELLFTEKPGALGALAAVVVDEAAWADGLEGVDASPLDLALDDIDPAVAIPGDLSGLETERLRFVHRMTRAALADLPDGPLPRAALQGAGMTEDTGREGAALSWRCVVDPGLIPGMPSAQRRAVVAAAAGNRQAMRRARFFGALRALLGDGGPGASGWAALAHADSDAGKVRVLRLRRRRDVAKGWRVPTLILDANLDPALVRPYWPSVEVTASIEARAPHMRVRQLTGRDWPKNAMVPDEYADAAENERRLKNSERLRAAVLREARATAGRVLCVVQLAVKEYWLTLGPLPGNLELAHHNSVAGRDEWGPGPGRDGVAKLIVIGRTLPRAKDVERIAEALTGSAVTVRASGRYERKPVAVPLADGSSVSAEADSHPDPIAEAVRWQVCEGEVVQIIGRGRGVNRTAENPLDVLVLTDRPLPLPVDEAVTWDELAPSFTDIMLAQSGVAVSEAADMPQVGPWENRAAAKTAIHRARKGANPERELGAAFSVTSPYRELPIGESYRNPPRGALLTGTYRRAGRGNLQPGRVVHDPAIVLDIRAWLEDHIGPLAFYEPDQPPPDPPRPPGRSRRPPASAADPGSEPATTAQESVMTPPSDQPGRAPGGTAAQAGTPAPAEAGPPSGPPPDAAADLAAMRARFAAASRGLSAFRPPPARGDETDHARRLAWWKRLGTMGPPRWPPSVPPPGGGGSGPGQHPRGPS